MNNNVLAKKLSEFQADIYWFHDAKNFDELALAAENIFKLLAFDGYVSKEAGLLISYAYQHADRAEEARRANNFDIEKTEYSLVQNKLFEAENLLGYKKSIAHYQTLWWMLFRHKNTVKVICYIFLQHLIPYGVLGTFKAILLTYYLVNVGFGHNKRDKELSVKYGEKYWKIILSKKRSTCPFIG